MKFWQYVVGTGLAILIFSGAVFSEYSKYAKISFMEKNPFTLMGEKTYPDKDFKDLITNDGEFIRIFNDSNIEITENSREIIEGKTFLGGTFFDDDNQNINYIRIDNLILRYPGSNVVVSRDLEQNTIEILNYGRTAQLYFPNDIIPFLIPSETQIEINHNQKYPLSKHENFYKYSKDFQLSLIKTDNPLYKVLKDGISEIRIFRNSFKNFATQMPNFWPKSTLDSLKSLNSKISGKKNLSKSVKEVLYKTFDINELIKSNDESSKILIKSSILELKFNLVDSKVKNSLNKIKEWQLFEKAQKIWLPTIDDLDLKYLYIDIWTTKKSGIPKLLRIMDYIELFNAQINSGAVDRQIILLKKELKKLKIENVSKFEISSLRRRLFCLLKSKVLSGETLREDVLETYIFIEKLELNIYQNKEALSEILEEKVGKLLEIIAEYINEEDDFSREIVKKLITFLQENIDLESFKQKYEKNENFKTTLKNIDLVGLSGLTPNEVATLNAIKIEENELNSLIKDTIIEPLENPNNLITNSKTLWKFLQKEGINININTFRTTHSSLKFETKFENTETGKRKIFGIFDYNGQIFKRLNLGDASIRKLQPHAIKTWLKEIAGKFEPIKTEEIEPEATGDIINQNSRKAIVNRQFLKDLLASLNFNVSKTNINAINIELTKLSAKNITFQDGEISGTNISLDYDIKSQKFSNVAINKKENKKYLSESPIDAKTLQEKSREFFREKKSD